jgi:predicted deacylase
MIETVTEVELPVSETLQIKRCRLMPEKQTEHMRRISIVTGIHGDELEGQYVCYELIRRIQEEKDRLRGIVDVYPAVNPMGIDSITRGIPNFDLDMNRTFPGTREGDMVDYIAARIIENVRGSDLVFDIHASNIYLTEIPQIRINERHRERLLPLAETANVDFVWVHEASTVLESTLAYSLNSIGTPVLVVEMGVGMRITKSLGSQLTDGILYTMKKMGVWEGTAPETVREPIISENPDDVIFLNASRSGIFIKDTEAGTYMHRGDTIGRLVDPLKGELLETVRAPGDGLLFTIREYPVVAEGSLIGRMLKQEAL